MTTTTTVPERHRVRPRGRPAELSAAVLGASGTSGAELVRLLKQHPRVELAFATSRAGTGLELDEIDPAAPPVALSHPDEVGWDAVDLAFLCLPNDTAGSFASRCFDAGCRVIDLSGTHRLKRPREHDRAYGTPRSQAHAAGAVYGLTEFARDSLRDCPFIANPGCYATATSLALGPLAEAGLVGGAPVVDAKSGVSGAGREATAKSHFCSVTEDVRPYLPGRAHRHVPEIEQFLRECDPAGRRHRIVFTPHLVPIDRGIEATIVVPRVRGGVDTVRRTLEERYESEPFVRMLPVDREARVRAVARTNRADIGVFPVDGTQSVVITVAIDNLLKGAAGQAVQNMNAMLGWPETLGLPGARELPDGGDRHD